MKVGVDLIEIERVRRALANPRLRERASPRAERAVTATRLNPAKRVMQRASRARRRSARLSAATGCASPGRRSRSSRSKPRASACGSHGRLRRTACAPKLDLSMTHSRDLAAAICVVLPRRVTGVRAAVHGRGDAAADEPYPGYPDSVPEPHGARGAAVAREAMLLPRGSPVRVLVRRRLERR